MRIAGKELLLEGYGVYTYGLYENDGDNITDFDTAVLPVPATRDKITVDCPLTGRKILISDIEKLCSGRTVLSGGLDLKGAHCTDYLKDTPYKILNAVPTAEGAIAKAIECSDRTLWQSRVLIIGFGKCSRAIYERLSGFKCDITVSARSENDIAELNSLFVKNIKTSEVDRIAGDFDFIFNTVDLDIINDLPSLKNTVLIDVSSKGCLDFNKANSLGIAAYKLPGIPGKTAPVTAGKTLARVLSTLIRKGE